MKAGPLAATVLAVSLSALPACTTRSPASDEAGADSPPGMAQACNAGAAQGAVGKVASADVVEQARRDAGAAIARVLRPGQVVTMEYRGDRLNVDVDDRNVVTGVRCG